MPHPATPDRGWVWCSAIPEICPLGEGMCLGCTVLADVAPLREPGQGFAGRDGGWPGKMPVDVGQRWVVLGGAVCTQFVPGHRSCLRRRGHGPPPLVWIG
jgi:hypothetical protein